MNVLKEMNIEKIYNFILYILKVSPSKDYDFINKSIYILYENELIETRRCLFYDKFLVRDNTPYLNLLECVVKNKELPKLNSINKFKENIKLVNNELVSTAEPDLDYISEYDKKTIDKFMENKLLIDNLNSKTSAPLLDTYRDELNSVDIVILYSNQLIRDIEFNYYLCKDQYID